jgi:hypothetical protein
MYCVKCEVQYHMGLTCDAYQALLRWKQEEGVTMHNIGKCVSLEARKLRLLSYLFIIIKGNLGFQPCPSCKQVIDRYDGCNAVKCKCGISFCWLCLKTDPTDSKSL